MIVPNSELMQLIQEAALSRGARARLTVTGSSMWPFLCHGDTVELAEPDACSIAVGKMLVVKRADGSYLLHRVVRLSGDTFYLAGDAQQQVEGPFSAGQVIGCITAAWRNSRRLPLEHPARRAAARLWIVLLPHRNGLSRLVSFFWRGVKWLGRLRPQTLTAGNHRSYNEQDFSQLFALLRSRPQAADPILLTGPIDWPRLLRQASSQEVLPLVYDRAQTLPASLQPPAEIQQRLQACYLHGAARNFRILEQLHTVLNSLSETGLPVIVLKGPHLAELVYHDVALRQIGDLDLLVRREDLEKVRAILQNLGYRQFGLIAGEGTHHESYAGPSGCAPVEVHWELSEAERLNTSETIENLWARARPATLAKVETRVLSPEDLFLHLCEHVYENHQFCVKLRHLYDFVALAEVSGEAFDWTYFLRQANQFRLIRPFAVLTQLLRDWFGLELPATGFDGECDAEVLAQAVLLAKSRILAGDFMEAPRKAAQIFGPHAPSSKLARIWRNLFLPKRWMEELYGCPASSPRIYLMYGYRVFHLAAKYGGLWWRLRFGPADTGLKTQIRVWDWLGSS